MRRLSLAALCLFSATAIAQPKTSDLMGLGMNGYLAGKLGEEAVARSNNVPIKVMNASGTPIAVINVDASNVSHINGSTTVSVDAAGTPEVQVTDDKATFVGNTGVIAAPTAVALAVGATTEHTFGNDLQTFSGNGAAIAAPTALGFNVGGTTGAVSLSNTGISFSGAGLGVKLPSYVPTMAATPVAGTNDFKVGINIVPTAAANTAALLAATPVVGQVYHIVNAAGANVRIKAGGAATMNGATAGGYVVLADKSSARCIASAADNYSCVLDVNPTPAGP